MATNLRLILPIAARSVIYLWSRVFPLLIPQPSHRRPAFVGTCRGSSRAQGHDNATYYPSKLCIVENGYFSNFSESQNTSKST